MLSIYRYINVILSLSDDIVTYYVTRYYDTPTTRPQHAHRKAVKATAILFPLLGLTNLLFFMPATYEEGTIAIKVYRYTNAFSQASQVKPRLNCSSCSVVFDVHRTPYIVPRTSYILVCRNLCCVYYDMQIGL